MLLTFGKTIFQSVKLVTGEILRVKREVQHWHVSHARRTRGVIQQLLMWRMQFVQVNVYNS